MLILQYQNHWKKDFEQIKSVLLEQLDSFQVEIEHVGSTSVPGLAAKPIIDIDIIYQKNDFEDIRKQLEKLGYYHNGNQGVEGREVFKRNKNLNSHTLDGVAHHLYMCPPDSDEFKKHILFRDHLRANITSREAYQELKLDLASRANQNKKKYAELKETEANGFICSCIKKQENE